MFVTFFALRKLPIISLRFSLFVYNVSVFVQSRVCHFSQRIKVFLHSTWKMILAKKAPILMFSEVQKSKGDLNITHAGALSVIRQRSTSYAVLLADCTHNHQRVIS